eukprot:11675522-Heterocapsa_arctica.AAC.2
MSGAPREPCATRVNTRYSPRKRATKKRCSRGRTRRASGRTPRRGVDHLGEQNSFALGRGRRHAALLGIEDDALLRLAGPDLGDDADAREDRLLPQELRDLGQGRKPAE